MILRVKVRDQQEIRTTVLLLEKLRGSYQTLAGMLALLVRGAAHFFSSLLQ
jgi:hypothetical protein